MDNINTIPGFQSLEECLDMMHSYTTRMKKDFSSTAINSARIMAFRSLLDLAEKYNEQMIERERTPNEKIHN